ncbi:MAG: hypothetical protein AB7I27_02970 [Bacteriovoracaceae bacterium]
MEKIVELFETYFMTLVHPFKIHQQFRHGLPLPHHEGHLYPPITLAESVGISWVFTIIRGVGKILILNFFLQTFLSMQSEEFPFLQELVQSSGVSTYYFLLFSAALDIIFFPVVTIIMTEVWAWIIRVYAKWLNPELPRDEIADQITTHALSSNLFYMIPILGDLIQPLLYYFLLYAGLRSNLETSRSLAIVILLTPTIFFMMLMSLLVLFVFYLVG